MDAQAMATHFPPGYLENYSGHKLVATCITAIVLSVFFVSARFVSRWLHNTPRGWDDCLMIPALIFSVLLAAQGLIGINYCGVGHHLEYIELNDPSQLLSLYKLLIFFPATYVIAVAFPKLSILAMYLRIFTAPFYRTIIYFIIYILVISSTVLFMLILFQCTPVNYFWDKTIEGGKCHFDIEKLFLYASLPNIITDVIMLALPMPFIFRLNMTRKVKVGLGITLLTGSSGLATSILRFVSFAHQTLFPDTPHAAVDLALYTILETSMYIVAACLPACRPLFNILRHPSRNMPLKYDNKNTPSSPDERITIDDIELQRSLDESISGSRNRSINGDLESNEGRYHGPGEEFRGMQGGFKRLGSDAGILLDSRRESSPSPPLFPAPSNLNPHSHSLPPPPSPHQQFHDLASGRLNENLGTSLQELRSASREHIFNPPVFAQQIFKQPERVHIADMHVGDLPMQREGGNQEPQAGYARIGIRIKQEIDVYYERSSL